MTKKEVKDTDAFGERKKRLVGIAQRLARAAEDRKDTDSAEILERFQRRFDENRFLVVFVGEFKRGKSTLVNALVGREVCPVHVTPRTARITHIQGAVDGAEAVEVHFAKERKSERLPLTAGILDELVARGGRREMEVSSVDVYVKPGTSLLTTGVVLVDTPGLESIYKDHDQITKEYVPRADLVVFCLSATQPLSARERDFLLGIQQQTRGKLLLTLNHRDQIPAQQLEETLEFIRSTLREQVFGSVGEEPHLIPVSGKDALAPGLDAAALVATGVPGLSDEIAKMLTEDRGRPLLRAVAEGQRAVAVALEKQYAAAREASLTVRGPDVAAKCRVLEAETREQCRELDQAVSAQIEEQAEDLAGKAIGRVGEWRQLLKTEIRELVKKYPNDTECRKLLPRELADLVQGWLLEYEGTLRKRFERVSAEATAQCSAGFDKIQKRTDELLSQSWAGAVLVEVQTANALGQLEAFANCIGGHTGGFGLASEALNTAFAVPENVKMLTLAAGVVSFIAMVGGPLGWGAALVSWLFVGLANLFRNSSWHQRVIKELDKVVDEQIAPRAEAAVTTEVWAFARGLQEHMTGHIASVRDRFLDVIEKLGRQVQAGQAQVGAEAARWEAAERELRGIAGEIDAFLKDLEGGGQVVAAATA